MAFAFLLSMPGAPFIYYGDEIGMRYVENLVSVEGGFNRTGSRSPMQWDGGVNAGFSAAPKHKLYIRQDESADRPTVQKQMEEKDSLYHEVQKLTALRQTHKALQSNGGITFVYAKENAYPMAYMRDFEEEKILVVLNPSEREESFEWSGKAGTIIYTQGDGIKISEDKITVPGGSAGFIEICG